MTNDRLSHEEEQTLKAMVALVNDSTKRIIEVTTPDSYDRMLANVVALRFLANAAYGLLDDDAKHMADTLVMAQTVVMGAALEARLGGDRH